MVGNLAKNGTIPVTYTVNPAIASPASVSFTIDSTSTAGALSQSITIGANTAGGASPGMNWSASVDKPWLTRSPASGVTGASNNLTLSLVTSELAKLNSGSHSAVLTITTNEPGVAPRMVPVILNLNLPTVTYAAPYIATAGVPGTAIVRGAGFNTVVSPVVKIGAANATSVTRVNDTELRINYGAITSGSGYPYAQPVYVDNALGLQMTRAQLVTVDATSYVATRIDSLGSKTNVLYNGERKDIYVGNLTNKTLERYRYNGSGWTKTVLALPNIRQSPTESIIISPDGKLIAAFDDDHLYLVNLDTFTLSKTVTLAPRFADYLGTIAFTNNGKILAADINQWSDIHIYDVLTETITNKGYGWIWGPQVRAPIDGSRVLVSAGCCGSSVVYDATTDTYDTSSGAPLMVRSTNIDASRYISSYNTDFYWVFDLGNTTPLSSISTTNAVGPALTRSGAIFYVLDTAQKMVRKYNASTAALLNSVSVSDLLSFGNLTLSEDEATLFIATDKEIKILPAP
jgi:hypothetical protein